jgi:hypothetical protein
VTGGEDEGAMSLAVNDPAVPEAPATADGESGQPAPMEADDGPGLGYLVVAGNLPSDARLQVPGQEIDVALTEGAQVDLPAGTHEVVVLAAGFNLYRSRGRRRPSRVASRARSRIAARWFRSLCGTRSRL